MRTSGRTTKASDVTAACDKISICSIGRCDAGGFLCIRRIQLLTYISEAWVMFASVSTGLSGSILSSNCSGGSGQAVTPDSGGRWSGLPKSVEGINNSRTFEKLQHVQEFHHPTLQMKNYGLKTGKEGKRTQGMNVQRNVRGEVWVDWLDWSWDV